MRLKLQQVLDSKGLSQTQLAHLIGVKRQFIHRLAKEKRARISLATLDRLCLALHCAPDELIELDPLRPPSLPSTIDTSLEPVNNG